MPPKKKGSFTKHGNRVGSRFGDRAKKFVLDARTGQYDQTRLAEDLSASVIDVAELWGGLFGMRGSPTAAVLELGSAIPATWKAAPGVAQTVLVEDPVPDDAVFPIGACKLARAGAGASNIDLQTVTVEDEDAFQLRVTFRDPTGAPLPLGEYYGTLTYTSVSNPGGPYFAAFVRGTVG